MAWINFLDEVKNKFPTHTALIDQATDRSLNYQSLVEEVDAWAWKLREWNVQKGDCVAYLKTNSLEHITLFFACARLGALFVPLNFRLACEELAEIVDRVEPKIFLGSGECDLPLRGQYQYIDIEEVELETSLAKGGFSTIESSMTDPLLMLFTSGTTGTPKGVMFHGEMLKSNQDQTCQNWGLVSTDKTLVETPFFHTGGYNVLCLPLLSIGGTSVLANKFDLDNVFETMEREKLSVYFGVPTMFQMIQEDTRFEKTSFESLRFFISGGAHCPKELIEAYQAKSLMFKQGFGLTEVGPNCFLLDEKDAIRKVGSIGKPMPHSEVTLIKEDGIAAKENEVGELMIRGPHVCLGYFKQEERFKDCVFDGYFKTGDLAKFDKDGFYYIVGRKKDMYISGGENVYPAEVEKRIRTHNEIFDAVVVAVPCEKWGEVGYCYLRGAKEFNVEDMREFLNPLLSRYKHPHFIERLEEFPLLASGKVDRKTLQAKAVEKVS
ncbi:MAG: AMP-binding protein [Halobacteriovoraceae bacterium]|nr:AMP-binding protein [Halobacteriovoraceae bacterium]